MILCYWMWLKKPTFWSRTVLHRKYNAKQAIIVMLQSILNLWPRLKGQGWELAKFHQQLHVPDNIVRFGSPQGTHSGPTEHNHICHVKQLAKTTQQRCLSSDEQLGNCVMEQHIVNLSFQFMDSTYTFSGQ